MTTSMGQSDQEALQCNSLQTTTDFSRINRASQTEKTMINAKLGVVPLVNVNASISSLFSRLARATWRMIRRTGSTNRILLLAKSSRVAIHAAIATTNYMNIIFRPANSSSKHYPSLLHQCAVQSRHNI